MITLKPSGGDDTGRLQTAIDALPESGGVIQLEAGRFRISSPLLIGDGSVHRESKRHGVTIRGEGIGLGPLATHAPAPSVIEWTGLSDWMFVFRGPVTGGGLRDLQLDGAGRAAGFLDLAHVAGATFRDVMCTGYTRLGMHVRTVRQQPYGSSGNVWDNFTITGPASLDASGCWFDGGAPGLDACSCLWLGGCITYGGSEKSFGLKLEGADNNVWMRTSFQTYNAGAIQAEGKKLGPSLTLVPWGFDRNFPIENVFFACSFSVTPSGEGLFGNLFLPMCQGDIFQSGPLPQNAGGVLSMDGFFGRLNPRSNSPDPAEPAARVTSTYGGHNGAGAFGFYRQGWSPKGVKDDQVGVLHADYFAGLTYRHLGQDVVRFGPEGIHVKQAGRWRKVKIDE